MKISDLQTVQKQNLKFSVDKEKLSSLWDLISKAFSIGELIFPGCDKCEDGRIKEKAVTGFGYVTKLCSCIKTVEEMNSIVAELGQAGLTPKMVDKYSLENYNDGMFSVDETLELLNKGKWLYLHGDVGTGKTHAAMICLYAAASTGYSVEYANVPVLLDKLRPQEQKDEEYMKFLCDVDFLILDDIGQEKVSSWVLERMYIIINERYVKDKMTVITSNCDLSMLLDKIGHKAIVSRIKGSSLPVYFIGKDKR